MAGKENIRTCLFCGCWWLSSYMTEPHLEIGAAFPDTPGSLAIFPSWGLYIIRQQANF